MCTGLWIFVAVVFAAVALMAVAMLWDTPRLVLSVLWMLRRRQGRDEYRRETEA